MKHLLLCVVSLFRHHHDAKPTLDVRLLDRAMVQLTLADDNKVICVYPIPPSSDK